MSAITLSAILQNVRMTVDGGWRITFDVSQSEVAKVMSLSALRDMELGIAIVPKEIEDPLTYLDRAF